MGRSDPRRQKQGELRRHHLHSDRTCRALSKQSGPGVRDWQKGDKVYGVTNAQFCGANAEYAIARANMIALKPLGITHIEAASVPVVAVTAWQMLFDYAHVERGQTVMILGAAGKRGCLRRAVSSESGTACDRSREGKGNRVRPKSWSRNRLRFATRKFRSQCLFLRPITRYGRRKDSGTLTR